MGTLSTAMERLAFTTVQLQNYRRPLKQAATVHNYETEKITRKASDAAEYIELFFRVPTPPGKSGIFFLKILGPGKSWIITFVMESPGN